MNELTELYAQMGISPAVYAYGEAALARLRERFDSIDQVAEYNQAKVLAAFRKNRVSATCFAASTGYGYNDEGRDKLEQVYADVFHTEAALVRPHITCGTHALTIALSANLLPGDELLSPCGLPYDTLQEVIGIRPSPCSLAEYGVTYNRIDTPLSLVRFVETTDGSDLNDLNLMSNTKRVVDQKGRDLLLFTAEYEINWALDKNENIVLKEFSQMEDFE